MKLIEKHPNLEQGVGVGQVVQGGDVHQAVADVLQQVLSVLVATVMLQPTHHQLHQEEHNHIVTDIGEKLLSIYDT